MTKIFLEGYLEFSDIITIKKGCIKVPVQSFLQFIEKPGKEPFYRVTARSVHIEDGLVTFSKNSRERCLDTDMETTTVRFTPKQLGQFVGTGAIIQIGATIWIPAWEVFPNDFRSTSVSKVFVHLTKPLPLD